MTTDANKWDSTVLSPDDAFSVLGNDTRMEILQTLGEADESLSFSELRDRVGVRDPGQFNYHLDKLMGHFVRQTDGGYELRQPGRHVIEAVLSGAVTDAPVLEPTKIDQSCPYCGAPIEVSYRQERVEMYCTECSGLFGDKTRDSIVQTDRGHLGGLTLPPAGVRERTASEVFRAAFIRTHLAHMARASGVCPRCSAPLTQSVRVCENHDPTDGFCDQCDNRYAAHIHGRCTNCIHEYESVFTIYLYDTPELLAFVAGHEYSPVSDVDWGWEWGEEILSVDPFKARFTFTIDDKSLILTVDDDLNVIDATERTTYETI